MTPDNSGEGAVVGGAAEVKKPRKAKRRFLRDPKKPVAATRVAVKQPKFEGKNEDLSSGMSMTALTQDNQISL